ncbi:putative S-protein4 [Cardamine amara subsp. amara]|uniref:S-protein4 n=1 Tax=Cardamine amara subsp. amara TaxID=228776 RepID=A0ABD1AR40_CARAN
MKHFIVFVLVIAMCVGLNEGIVCSSDSRDPRCGGSGCIHNNLEFRNQLTPGSVLKVNCTSNRNEARGVHEVKFNQAYDFNFPESSSIRIVWACHLRYGPKMEYFQTIWRAYRGAFSRRCGQVRSWVAKVDGIYLDRNGVPQGRLHNWVK